MKGFLTELPKVLKELEGMGQEGDWQAQYKGLSFEQFWDRIGRPKKNGREFEILDYEQAILKALQKHRRIWIKKSRGLGITEFFLRYIAWQCLKDNQLRNAQIAIIVGPKWELAINLIKRMKRLLEQYPLPETNERKLVLNGCEIEAYPSNHPETIRSPENMKIIFLDEADFFNPNEFKIVKDAAEGYTAKTNPLIVMVSTPNLPGGQYDDMERNDQAYHKIFMPYTVGLGTIYDPAEIEEAKKLPSFEREYNLKYGYGIGNIFPYQLVDACVAQYPLALQSGEAVLLVDPAYGDDQSGSKFGIVGMERRNDGLVYVTLAEQLSRASPSAMLNHVAELAKAYRTVRVDGHYKGEIRDLQERGVDAQPVEFSKKLSEMTIASATAIKEQKVRLHPAFSDLIYQLKAVEFNEKGHPDKKKLRFDLGDCLLMGCDYYFTGVSAWADLGRD